MSDRPVTTEQQKDSLLSNPPAVPAEGVEVVPLPEVLRQVRRDSRRQPQNYLDETIVPFGGE